MKVREEHEELVREVLSARMDIAAQVAGQIAARFCDVTTELRAAEGNKDAQRKMVQAEQVAAQTAWRIARRLQEIQVMNHSEEMARWDAKDGEGAEDAPGAEGAAPREGFFGRLFGGKKEAA